MENYIIDSRHTIDLTITDLTVLYQSEPWLKLESFENTKYQNKIVKWRNNIPYIREMNIFEKYYYKKLRRSNK